ncbi:substrate-binding domain-containing protein [Hydrogenophaga sp.]|uniref:sugar ABC transporter substrate-binding protein n=1 Tax=Hydrogenophaga sp. TaxID=1904254 RepID=UPI00271BEFF4|nr:substrate-binding domain-containing protein [Hydrogenophaga sp.]MDO9435915.1 substrate-binding domain-containing protein [Hydrogenophaga sp.]
MMKKLVKNPLRVLLAGAMAALPAWSVHAQPDVSGGADRSKEYVKGVPSINELMKGDVEAPPASGPKGVPGKRIWWISCSQNVPTCALMGDAAKEAAKVLGWTIQIGDGKLSAVTYAETIRIALAQKPDAIVVQGIACGNIKQPLNEARTQGVPVLSLQGPDCDEPPENGKPLFSGPMRYNSQVTTMERATYLRGKLAAQYAINITKGQARIIFERGNDPIIEPINRGFIDELKKCEGCQIVKTVDYVPTDQGPDGALAQGLTAALAQHPNATVLYAPYDANLTLSRGAQIVRQSGRSLFVIGADGTPAGLDLVRQGLVTVETGGKAFDWYAWGAMDNLNRMFSGQPTVAQGLGWQPVDKLRNLPAKPGSPVAAPFDVQSHYTKIWKGDK